MCIGGERGGSLEARHLAARGARFGATQKGAPPQTRNEQIGNQSTDLVVVDLDEARLAVGIDDDDSLDHVSVFEGSFRRGSQVKLENLIF